MMSAFSLCLETSGAVIAVETIKVLIGLAQPLNNNLSVSNKKENGRCCIGALAL